MIFSGIHFWMEVVLLNKLGKNYAVLHQKESDYFVEHLNSFSSIIKSHLMTHCFSKKQKNGCFFCGYLFLKKNKLYSIWVNKCRIAQQSLVLLSCNYGRVQCQNNHMPTGVKTSPCISTFLPHLIATISSQVIGWVRKRWSLPRRTLRSWQTLPERGFRRAGASGAADLSSSCRGGGVN